MISNDIFSAHLDNEEKPLCYVCSSRDNLNCGKSNPAYALANCPNNTDQCLTAIDQDGYTVRQCISNETNNANLKSFRMHSICQESKCNGEIFPENRLQCFQCDGGRSCNRLKTNENIFLEEQPCRVYSKYDQCFMYMDDGINNFIN